MSPFNLCKTTIKTPINKIIIGEYYKDFSFVLILNY